MPRVISTEQLNDLYSDPLECAKLIGLEYSSDITPGHSRRKMGKGFSYIDHNGKSLSTQDTERLKSLAIPPAWQDVWICTKPTGHILVTGVDERGRKQYIYHPKWRVVRDLLKFYRMIIFAEQLPKLRKVIDAHLRDKCTEFHKVIAAMLWILDNTYIRVGNDIYFEQNESVGLTTLTDKNVIIAGSVVTFAFRAKSGKEQQFTIEHPGVAEIIAGARAIPGGRLFQYRDKEGKKHNISASDINAYLQDVTSAPISAKDFRTWGGTLMAFNHLIENQDSKKKTEKLVIEAVDAAANVLGNTRAVAKSSYVHPHLLEIYGSKNFDYYYKQANQSRKKQGLDKRETELLKFLEILFTKEFDLLKN